MASKTRTNFISADKVKAILTDPHRAFKNEKKTGLVASLYYILPLLAVYAVFSGLLVWLSPFGAPAAAITVVMTFVGAIIGLVLGGLWLHLFVYLCGGRQGVEQTLKVEFTSATPFALLGWIPFINLLATLWSIVLGVFGLKELQGMSTGRAVLATAASLIAALVIIILIVTAIVMTVGPAIMFAYDGQTVLY